MTTSVETKSFLKSCAKIFYFCVNKLWLLVATIIILLALIHLLLSFLLPKINDYQAEIVTWIETKYQVDVKVDRIDAGWNVQGPLVKLTNFRVRSDDGTYDILNVGSATLYFDIISSIWNRRFSTQEILIDQADLKFYINRKLGVAFDQETDIDPPIDLENASHKLIDAIFGQRKIVVSDSSLKLITLSGIELSYHVDQLEVKKYNNIHQLVGLLSHKGGGKLELVTEIYGDPTLISSHSNIYVKASDIDISDLPWQDSSSYPKQGRLSWQFWGTWKNKHWQLANVKVDLNHLNWDQSETQANNKATAFLSWQHDDIQTGYLSVHHFNVESHNLDKVDSRVNLPAFFVKFKREDNEIISWNLLMQDFPLKPLALYINSIVKNDNKAIQIIGSLNNRPQVDNLSLTIKKISDHWLKPKLKINFSILDKEIADNSKARKSILGSLKLDSRKTSVLLKAKKTHIDFGDLFRAPVEVGEFQSYLTFSIDDDSNVSVKINSLSLANNDLSMQSRGQLFWQDKQAHISLYNEITRLDISKKYKYLPVSIMTKNLVQYLDSGVKTGKFPLIKTAVRGPLNGFPYDNQDGMFFVLGKLRNTEYRYLPDWPAVKGLDADLLF
ncbi:MAG: DUF3971 domain-containing protein [Enterobacterales bacterium]|nr:DUF3971 domain-containing protein [Enterobacterales bacterium]